MSVLIFIPLYLVMKTAGTPGALFFSAALTLGAGLFAGRADLQRIRETGQDPDRRLPTSLLWRKGVTYLYTRASVLGRSRNIAITNTACAALVLLAAIVIATSVGGAGGGTGGGVFSGTDTADGLRATYAAQGYSPSRVTATCEDAPRKAGAISDCAVTLNSIAVRVRVTFDDDQGHFTAQPY